MFTRAKQASRRRSVTTTALQRTAVILPYYCVTTLEYG